MHNLNTYYSLLNSDIFLFRFYNVYYTFYINYLVLILVWFNLALAIFEKPAVTGYELPYWVRVS